MRHHLVLLPAVLCGQLAFAAGPGVGASKPPAPYTPVKASTSEFRCLGRKTELGGLLLPKQIYAAGQPLLAAPARIVMEPDLFAGAKGKGKVTHKTADLLYFAFVAMPTPISRERLGFVGPNLRARPHNCSSRYGYCPP